MTVLYDPANRLAGIGFPPNHTHIVMRRGAQIEHRIQGRDNTFRPVVDRLLAEP